jgi:hypothetical protein
MRILSTTLATGLTTTHDTLQHAVTWLQAQPDAPAQVVRRSLSNAARQGVEYAGVMWRLESAKVVTATTPPTVNTPAHADASVNASVDVSVDASVNASVDPSIETADLGMPIPPDPAEATAATLGQLRKLRYTLGDLMFAGPMRTTTCGLLSVLDFLRIVHGNKGTEPKKLWERFKNAEVSDLTPLIKYMRVGRGHPTPFATVQTLVQMLVMIRTARSRAFRAHASDVLIAFLRGDPAVATALEENRRFLADNGGEQGTGAYGQIVSQTLQVAGWHHKLQIGTQCATNAVMAVPLTGAHHVAQGDVLADFIKGLVVYVILFGIKMVGDDQEVLFVKIGSSDSPRNRWSDHFAQLRKATFPGHTPDETAPRTFEVWGVLQAPDTRAMKELETRLQLSFASHKVNGLINAGGGNGSEVFMVAPTGLPPLDCEAVLAKGCAIRDELVKEAAEGDERRYAIAMKELEIKTRDQDIAMLDRQIRLRELELAAIDKTTA